MSPGEDKRWVGAVHSSGEDRESNKEGGTMNQPNVWSQIDSSSDTVCVLYVLC